MAGASHNASARKLDKDYTVDVNVSSCLNFDCQADFHIPNEKIDKDEIRIKINSVGAVTMRVPIKVCKYLVNAVIDTGAEVTVMSETLFNSLTAEQYIHVCTHEKSRILVTAEEGKEMRSRGIVRVPLKLGEEEFAWPVYIAPIADELLLGCDLLDAKDITINCRKGLMINGKWISCDVTRHLDRTAKLFITKTITIPAESEIIATGKIDYPKLIDAEYATVEPTFEDQRAVMIARMVIDPHRKEIPVRIANTSSLPVKLKKGYLVGEVQAIEHLVDIANEHDTDDEQINLNTISEEKNSHTPADQVNHEYLNKSDMQFLRKQAKTVDIYKINRTVTSTVIPTEATEGNLVNGDEVPGHLRQLFEETCTELEGPDQKLELAKVLRRYENAFAKNKMDLGTCSLTKHQIDTCGAAPIRQPYRRMPKAFEGEEETYLKQQIEAGVVVPSTSSWASPVALVRKKDGSVRFCVEYRRLNEVTVKDAYPLPRIDMVLDCLSSARLFSTVDLQSGYWQLEMHPKDRHKTAFITKYGLFEYSKLPFGLCNAPGTFQRCMELIFQGLQWKTVLIYLDDIIVFSSRFDEHMQRLGEVQNHLQKAGLKLKPSKCALLKKQVLYLGHVVSPEGLSPNPELVQAVRAWETPKCVRHVQQFLGLCNYYRRFIKDFSEIASPISQLTRKDKQFEWTEECKAAFQNLKDILCTSPVLAYPKEGSPYVLDTDASDVGIGAVLSQEQDGEERVIAYASKKLDRQQQRYCVTRRELLAVVTFVHQFRHYLLGRKFLLRTDHNSLRWMFGFKDPQGQMARWLEVLSQYNFDIMHREGRKHQNADALSRQSESSEISCPAYNRNEIPANLPCGGCTKCIKMHESWVSFITEVDTVVPLSANMESSKSLSSLGRGPCHDGTQQCRRMTTRQSSKANANQDQQNHPHETETISNWMPGYSTAEISKAQQEDPTLMEVWKWVTDGHKPPRDEIACKNPAVRLYWLNFENLVQEDNVLYQKWISPKGYFLQMLVSKKLQEELATMCHDTLLGGHLGINKTIHKIKQRFH